VKSVLFIANSIPSPPRDGNELPSARILEELASRFRVDLLVLGERDHAGSSREANLPNGVRLFRALPERQTSLRRVLAEALGRRPGYFDASFTGEDLERHLPTWDYDLAWVSPVSCLGFIEFAHRRGYPVAKKIAIGLNDVTTGLYAETFASAFSGVTRFSGSRLLRGARLPSVARHERRYMGQIDLVHVQTSVELSRLKRLLGSRPSPRVVVAPNGKKQELTHVRYSGASSRKVLFMTHLDETRAVESRWFLKRVWPEVVRSVPGAELWIAGTPPAPGASLSTRALGSNVRILGYVDDLADLYGQIAVAVVPIYHGTGLVNRVQDAITAGVPSVSTSMALATIDGAIPGVHALQADEAKAFAMTLSQALLDPDLLNRVARNARELSARLPSWTDSLGRIGDSVMELL
jgi:glycosyltransferase involved in cell wall biosynthesis